MYYNCVLTGGMKEVHSSLHGSLIKTHCLTHPAPVMKTKKKQIFTESHLNLVSYCVCALLKTMKSTKVQTRGELHMRGTPN